MTIPTYTGTVTISVTSRDRDMWRLGERTAERHILFPELFDTEEEEVLIAYHARLEELGLDDTAMPFPGPATYAVKATYETIGGCIPLSSIVIRGGSDDEPALSQHYDADALNRSNFRGDGFEPAANYFWPPAWSEERLAAAHKYVAAKWGATAEQEAEA